MAKAPTIEIKTPRLRIQCPGCEKLLLIFVTGCAIIETVCPRCRKMIRIEPAAKIVPRVTKGQKCTQDVDFSPG